MFAGIYACLFETKPYSQGLMFAAELSQVLLII